MTTIIPIDTPTLGDRSYLAHDGTVALVVDPQRDIDRVIELAEREGVRITHVFETHIHNDYVTGGFALAQVTGAQYYVNAEDPVQFERVPTHDGDVISVSDQLTVTAIATPGHTFTHLSYALDNGAQRIGVFTGGSLLFGSTGRPDLLGPDHADALAHHQYSSAHRIAAEAPDDAMVLPTHGFGSFCSATQSDATSSTIGDEKRLNPVLTTAEHDWVEEILAGLDAWPAYYKHMAPANAAGPGAPDLSPATPADKADIRAALEAGEWVVDLRNRVAFAAAHVGKSLNFGLDGQFVTYLGWMIPWGTPVVLLGETAEQIEEAQREMVRIGIERPERTAIGGPADWSDEPASVLHRATFADLERVRHHRPVQILDVRRRLEFATSHIDGAAHIPLHELVTRIDDVPDGEIWVHCAGGYRASIAASVLAAAGRDVVAVDDSFEEHAAQSGLPIVTR